MTDLYTIDKKSNGVYYISLNRPELHNAFNAKLIKDLTQLFISFEQDSNIRLIVLQGEGKSFCAGADLNWMKSMVSYTEEENFKDSNDLFAMFEAINTVSVPVISKVSGAALGGGIGLVAASDYVLAADNSKFGLTEVRLGLVPAVISPFVINKIGESYARAYFLSGERFSARRAYEIGLVHDVVSQSEIETKLESIVKSFLKAGPIASKVSKKLIAGVSHSDKSNLPKDHSSFTCGEIARLRISDEGQEGMNALLEKRKPNWMES